MSKNPLEMGLDRYIEIMGVLNALIPDLQTNRQLALWIDELVAATVVHKLNQILAGEDPEKLIKEIKVEFELRWADENAGERAQAIVACSQLGSQKE